MVGYSMGGMVPTYLAGSAVGTGRVVAGVCIGPVHPSPAVADVFKKRVPAVRDGGMEAMADTIPSAATGSGATSLHRAFVREMLMAQEVEGYIANCRAIGELPSFSSAVLVRIRLLGNSIPLGFWPKSSSVCLDSMVESTSLIERGTIRTRDAAELRGCEGSGADYCGGGG